MDPKKIREQVRAALAAKLAERKKHTDQIAALRAQVEAGGNAVTDQQITDALAARSAVDAEIDQLEARDKELTVEIERESAIDRLQATVAAPTSGVAGGTGVTLQGAERSVSMGAEERTYAPHKERAFDQGRGEFRRGAKPGAEFERDVAAAFLGDYEAQERLRRHMAEERAERGEFLNRDVGTGAFTGLIVPQYLTDLYAPAAAARRPFADAIRQRPLPPQGMTLNISRITTATATALQASENSAVQETDTDDTLLTINVQTNAGQQDLSRQAIERGAGVEAVVLDDLFRQYATTLDSTLINQATNGLVNVATAVTYTDASPTAAELYPKILEGLAGVEAALLDRGSGDNIVVAHSRRWYWMQSQVGTSWPFMGQPGLAPQQGGVNYGVAYGSGFRGLLPNGTPVVVDNNIPTNLGAGTNEDRIFVVDRNECHLWEDPSAPMFIRAEQTGAGSLSIKLVVYGYFAYTHARYAHSRQVSGTGLVAPTF